jgi:hypothetical protein
MTLAKSTCILFLLFTLISCKPQRQNINTTTQEQKIDTLSQQEIAYNEIVAKDIRFHGEVVLNNVPTNTLLVVDSNMTTEVEHGDKINIVDYLEPLGFTSEAKKIQIGSGKELLLIRYFSGGAHCCFVYEAFSYDADINAYMYMDQFYCEECSGELTYPIPYYEWMDYFYCAYAYGSGINCPNAWYRSSMHLIDGKFVAKVKGNIKVLERCFKEFCNTATIPELNKNGDDDGTRESVLNLLYQIYTLGPKDIEDVKQLYFRHFPSVKDKETLWGEIEKFILSNRIVIYQHNNQNIKE